MKTCKKCAQDKPIESFTVDVRYKDGRYPWCAECRRAWRQGRKERQLQLQRDWKQQNLDHARQQGRETYYRHKEEYSAKRREYDRKRWKNDEEYRKHKRDTDRVRYQTSPATQLRKKAAGERYYHRVRDMVDFRRKRAMQSRIDKQRRRARLALVENTLTVQEWHAILKEQEHRCAACQRHFGMLLRPAIDHIVPLSKGGGTTKANTQALCTSCNSRKRTKTIDYRRLTQDSFLDGDDT